MGKLLFTLQNTIVSFKKEKFSVQKIILKITQFISFFEIPVNLLQ